MAKYKRIVTTEAGLKLLAAAVAGGTVTFTALKTGSGTYSGTEDLSVMTDLKSARQTFSVSSVTRTGTQVKLRSVLNNDNLTEGYSMTEIGLYAKNTDTGADFLYAIIVAELADYLPAYSVAPASITMELYIELTEAENGVTFTTEVIEGAYVPVESFNEHVTDNVIHITAAERSSWNAKLTTTGNASNTTATFTEATTLAALATGSKLSVLFGALAKAVSSLISHLANKSNPHSVTKTQVGLGSVDNTSDADKPVSTATQTELNKKALAADLTAHTGNTGNPHSVTKSQVGLSNVPNVSTNDQTPSYTAANALTALASGEKLSVAFGKLSKAVSDLISHIAAKATSSVLGHVKISDIYKKIVGGEAEQLAASQAAVYTVYDTCLKRYALGEINVDTTDGCWTVDISANDGSRGTVPDSWVNVTQTTSQHFYVQTAIHCVTSEDTTRKDAHMWVREKYNNGSWSTWQRILSETVIANHVAATEAGYILDARQGKILSDRLATIEAKNVDYRTLLENNQLASYTTESTLTLYNSRKFSEQGTYLSFTIVEGTIRGSAVVPLNYFQAFGVTLSVRGSDNTYKEVVVKYASDETITVKSTGSFTASTYLMITTFLFKTKG